MLKMDIMNIQFPDDFFDVIYCSHVLEHVHNDMQAMRELHRVLKKDGWAILLVPITAAKTFEDDSITDPDLRLQAFGQRDHLRRYGRDFAERLRRANFRVKVTSVSDVLAKGEIVRMGLSPASGYIHYCTKQ